jgi:hypothetical protein
VYYFVAGEALSEGSVLTKSQANVLEYSAYYFAASALTVLCGSLFIMGFVLTAWAGSVNSPGEAGERSRTEK